MILKVKRIYFIYVPSIIDPFGPPQVEIDGELIQISRRKSLALFAYLAVTQQGHSRDELATMFWPEADQSRARASLRSAL